MSYHQSEICTTILKIKGPNRIQPKIYAFVTYMLRNGDRDVLEMFVFHN